MRYDDTTARLVSGALDRLIANVVPAPQDLDAAIEMLNRILENRQPVPAPLRGE